VYDLDVDLGSMTMTSMPVDGGFTNGRWKTSVERKDLAIFRRMK
jgi:hypothetical protein